MKAPRRRLVIPIWLCCPVYTTNTSRNISFPCCVFCYLDIVPFLYSKFKRKTQWYLQFGSLFLDKMCNFCTHTNSLEILLLNKIEGFFYKIVCVGFLFNFVKCTSAFLFIEIVKLINSFCY